MGFFFFFKIFFLFLAGEVFFFVLFCFVLFFLFTAPPMAYGSSWARGPMGAAAKAYATAIPDLSHTCDLYHSLQQRWILNPLSEARDQTRILMETRSGP